jgi:hypothetical protein
MPLSLGVWRRTPEGLNRLDEKKSGRNIGEVQGKCSKCVGILVFVLVIFVTLFPLLLMSVARKNSVTLPPVRAEMSLQLATYEPLFEMDNIPKVMNDPKVDQVGYNYLADNQYLIPGLKEENVYVTHLGNRSKSVWAISPSSRTDMKSALEHAAADEDFKLHVWVRWSFEREVEAELSSTVQSVASGSHRTTLDKKQVDQLSRAMTDPAVVVSLPEIVPLFVHLAAGDSTNTEVATLPQNARESYTSCSLQRNVQNEIEWWELTSTKPSKWQRDNQVELISFSDQVIPPTYAFLTNYGIIGLYVSIVLVIGKFMRMFVTDLTTRIRYDSMPQVDTLRNLVTAISTSRSLDPPDLLLEEELYHLLISIYRRDDALFAWTAVHNQGSKED